MVRPNFLREHVACIVCAFVVWSIPAFTHAYVPLVVEHTSVSDIHVVEDPTLLQYFYGRLNNFPHTYEITSAVPFTLSAEVLIPELPDARGEVNGIIVRGEGKQGRVVEVARMLARDAGWESFREPWGGDRYKRGSGYAGEVEPGTYRIEVSTPNNDVPYVLVIGTEADRGNVSYVDMVKRIGDVKEYYGHSRYMVIVSPYVYGPLIGIILLGCVLWFVRRRYSS